MKLIKPPTLIDTEEKPSIFLAGSIEMGTAEHWQVKVEKHFLNDDVCVLNPRRDVWDPSVKQSYYDDTFRKQVEWELEGQETADVIAMYFDPKTKSPITLMELGLFAESGKIIVCCPKGFWRKGNIEVVCFKYGIPLSTEFDIFLQEVRNKLDHS